MELGSAVPSVQTTLWPDCTRTATRPRSRSATTTCKQPVQGTKEQRGREFLFVASAAGMTPDRPFRPLLLTRPQSLRCGFRPASEAFFCFAVQVSRPERAKVHPAQGTALGMVAGHLARGRSNGPTVPHAAIRNDWPVGPRTESYRPPIPRRCPGLGKGGAFGPYVDLMP